MVSKPESAKFQDGGLPEEQPRANPSGATTLEELMRRRLSRRAALKSMGGLGALGGMALLAGCADAGEGAPPDGTSLRFREVPHGVSPDLVVPPGYRAQVLLRWGDALDGSGSDGFRPEGVTPESAAATFGYNCDLTAFLPMPDSLRRSSRGVLAVNHEFGFSPMMWPGAPLPAQLSTQQLRADIAAQGMSLVQIELDGDDWRAVPSPLARRITPHTPMRFDGPAAGSNRMRVSWARTGHTRGTYANCSGGVTPWGTVLTAEENVDLYFGGDPNATPEAANHRRFGLTGDSPTQWYRADPRFDLARDPRYAMHTGWVVEVDPFDPKAPPVKHTALGRCKHEGATTTINGDGRAVVYMGDDQKFEYLYRFVSSGRYRPQGGAGRDPGAARHNRALLSRGVLSVARFDDGGGLRWLPLVYGQGPLTPDNGFRSQGDVVLDVRRAADLVQATPLDRPEGVAIGRDGRVYLALTANSDRERDGVDAANPRPGNRWGHVLEIVPPGGDHATETASWGIFLMGGNPFTDGGLYADGTSENGHLAKPDNLAVDPGGRLWVATDGSEAALGTADGLWACDLQGRGRRLTRHFLRVPVGAEATGPSFTPDGTTLFLSVQHPGQNLQGYEDASTRWPDMRLDMPPRPSVVAVRREDGGVVGS